MAALLTASMAMTTVGLYRNFHSRQTASIDERTAHRTTLVHLVLAHCAVASDASPAKVDARMNAVRHSIAVAVAEAMEIPVHRTRDSNDAVAVALGRHVDHDSYHLDRRASRTVDWLDAQYATLCTYNRGSAGTPGTKTRSHDARHQPCRANCDERRAFVVDRCAMAHRDSRRRCCCSKKVRLDHSRFCHATMNYKTCRRFQSARVSTAGAVAKCTVRVQSVPLKTSFPFPDNVPSISARLAFYRK